ncbi:hypothetical protein HU200_024277 [Digitaria exilis]|uniref:Uncharacterized protein n=1 Tax=Digitaria exilis TaxID=1010633 RepID=A0A835C1W8_9POAL|nr:hypothetical protein HU200_024277 [Digitaria exilis]
MICDAGSTSFCFCHDYAWPSNCHRNLECTRSLVTDGDEFHLTEEQEKWAADIMLSVTLVKLVLVINC